MTDSVLEESATSIMVEVNQNIEAAFSSGSLVNTHETVQYHEFKNYCHKSEIRVADQYTLQIFVLLAVHLSIILDNEQRDAHLLYFTIYLLRSSTCSEHYMLIIRRLKCIDAASGIVLSVSGRPLHRLGEKSPNLCIGRPLTERMIPDAASVQFSLLMMSILCLKHVEECNKYIVK